MSNNHYSVEFKTKAVKQVTDRFYNVTNVAKQLDESYAWIKKYRLESGAV